MAKREVIRLKKVDLDRAIIRGLSRSAWEKKSRRPIREQVQTAKTKKLPRHKKNFTNLDEEF